MPTNTNLLLLGSQRYGSVRPGVSGTFPGKIKQLFLTTCINTIYVFFPARCSPTPLPVTIPLRWPVSSGNDRQTQ